MLLLLPLVSLSALWGFALNLTVGDGVALLRSYDLYQGVGMASTELGLQIQAERTQASVAISSGVITSVTGEQRGRTDRTAEAFRNAALTADSGGPETSAALDGVLRQLDRLPGIRAGIDGGQRDRLNALTQYNQILDSVFLLYDRLVAVPDLGIFRQAVAMQSMGNAREMIARENALVSGALIDERLSRREREAFGEYVATRRFLHTRGLASLDGELAGPYRDVFASPAFKRFTELERAVVAAPGDRLPVELDTWKATVDGLSASLDQLGVSASAVLSDRSASVATGILARIAVAGGVGLLAVIASIVISVRFGRRLSGELAGLRSAALDLADVRLPRLVERLRLGEKVDVRAETPPIETAGDSAEVRDVAHAFDSVRRTAVEAAVGQADLRRGVSQVFVNLARRKQGLLHRQLTLLDGMQRRTNDPDALEDLFRLDHLTTRMRRHAESLIILSGAAPGRTWRNPVPVLDVVRAALAEIEDYRRVKVTPMPAASVDGAAVADLTHLLSELIENATVYSPPQTSVTVRGDVVANGFTVEVEDRGLGLSATEYAMVNERLASPPEFDLADSDRLGLFVVGQLAARHGVQVTLRNSPFGGTTAIVLIPRAVLAETDSPLAPAVARGPEAPAGDAPRAVAPSPLTAAGGARQNGGRPNAGRQGGGLPRRTRTTSRPTPGGVPDGSPTGRPPLAAPTLTVVPGSPVPETAPGTDPGQTRESARRADGTGEERAGRAARRAATAETAATAGDTAETAAGSATETTGPRELPRRVRQASLVPQLRQETQAPAPPEPEPDPPAEGRSPDEVRALFSAFQAGTRRAREENEDLAHHTTADKRD
ncbi:nitrate- and nitrite sensing domain-containing protein [Streptosporangium sp. NPDC048047]|uniref:sensor histidine kinase n=1 Tax=Streptosporangium sp. NPDC048047 TaxID=3155748 RepID=UPI003428173D